MENEIEELFLQYLRTLELPEQLEIHNGQDVLAALTNDAEEDLMHEIWQRIKYTTNYMSIVSRLKDEIRLVIIEEDESDSCWEHEE